MRDGLRRPAPRKHLWRMPWATLTLTMAGITLSGPLMRRWIMAALSVCLVGAFAHAAAAPLSLPVETLDGKALQLPAAWPPQPVLLIVGFSRASREPCRAWSERWQAEPVGGLAVYQIAVIDDVPGLLLGLVARGIRKGVPAALRGRFLLVTERGEAWRKLAAYAEPDAAYLLLFDARHELRWRASEPLSEASWRASRVAVEQTVARP